MEIDLSHQLQQLRESGAYWQSFLERDDFEIGVLYLRPGQEDVQTPHHSDEVYFILEGDGYLNLNGQDHEIKPARAFIVDRGTPHTFHGNTVPIVGYYVLN